MQTSVHKQAIYWLFPSQSTKSSFAKLTGKENNRRQSIKSWIER